MIFDVGGCMHGLSSLAGLDREAVSEWGAMSTYLVVSGGETGVVCPGGALLENACNSKKKKRRFHR
jgi:hypothetical protein